MSIISTIRQLFKSPFDHGTAHALYVSIVRQARHPAFYDRFEVQDTPEGRFDLVAVHTYLVLRLLRQERDRTKELAQALFDLMFADIDQNLREMGYGDTGVSKRIKKMAEGFYGRINAYDAGLDAAEQDKGSLAALEGALDRNLYRDTIASPKTVTAMAQYVRTQAASLTGQGIDAMMDGDVSFSEPDPKEEGENHAHTNE